MPYADLPPGEEWDGETHCIVIAAEAPASSNAANNGGTNALKLRKSIRCKNLSGTFSACPSPATPITAPGMLEAILQIFYLKQFKAADYNAIGQIVRFPADQNIDNQTEQSNIGDAINLGTGYPLLAVAHAKVWQTATSGGYNVPINVHFGEPGLLIEEGYYIVVHMDQISQYVAAGGTVDMELQTVLTYRPVKHRGGSKGKL